MDLQQRQGTGPAFSIPSLMSLPAGYLDFHISESLIVSWGTEPPADKEQSRALWETPLRRKTAIYSYMSRSMKTCKKVSKTQVQDQERQDDGVISHPTTSEAVLAWTGLGPGHDLARRKLLCHGARASAQRPTHPLRLSRPTRQACAFPACPEHRLKRPGWHLAPDPRQACAFPVPPGHQLSGPRVL